MKLNLASLFLSFTAFAVAQEEATSTVVELAIATEDLSTLVAAVQAADLVDTLSDPTGTFTVFAPTNTAFEVVDPKFLTAPWKTHLTNVLLYHVLDSEVAAGDVEDGMLITALSGDNFTATVNGTTPDVFFGTELFSSQVLTPDVDASNGIVHVVNAVFLPSWVSLTLADIALNVDGFDSVSIFITRAGLEDEIAAENRTIFAPNAEAFSAISPQLTAQLANDDSLIADILKHHMVEGVWSKAALSDGLELTALDGNTLTISMSGDSVMMIESSAIVDFNFLASNGVSHVISTILLPPKLQSGNETGSSAPDAPPVNSPAPVATPPVAPTSDARAWGSAFSLFTAAFLALL